MILVGARNFFPSELLPYSVKITNQPIDVSCLRTWLGGFDPVCRNQKPLGQTQQHIECLREASLSINPYRASNEPRQMFGLMRSRKVGEPIERAVKARRARQRGVSITHFNELTEPIVQIPSGSCQGFKLLANFGRRNLIQIAGLELPKNPNGG